MIIVYNVVMVLCLLFSLYFGITGLFAFKKIKYHHKNTKNNKFAILIPCRNEEAVIGNLIDRIWNKNVIIFMDLGKSIYLNFAYIYVLIAWIGLAAILTKNTMKILKEKKERKSEHKSK